MMECWEIRSLKNDLEMLAFLVDKYKIPCEINEVHNLLGKFHIIDNFEYSLSNIVFKIDKKISGSQPSMEHYDIYLNNNIYTALDKKTDSDCITQYLFEINIDGHVSDKNYPLRSCWHLDKHIESSDCSDGEPKYTHPSYHFQFGGNFIENCETGEIGILANPRIPHPPMDVFLGFNFIINNFYSKKDYTFVAQIIKDNDYTEIIKRAQKRLWNPYFQAFETDCNHKDFTIKKIFPLYIS